MFEYYWIEALWYGILSALIFNRSYEIFSNRSIIRLMWLLLVLVPFLTGSWYVFTVLLFVASGIVVAFKMDLGRSIGLWWPVNMAVWQLVRFSIVCGIQYIDNLISDRVCVAQPQMTVTEVIRPVMHDFSHNVGDKLFWMQKDQIDMFCNVELERSDLFTHETIQSYNHRTFHAAGVDPKSLADKKALCAEASEPRDGEGDLEGDHQQAVLLTKMLVIKFAAVRQYELFIDDRIDIMITKATNLLLLLQSLPKGGSFWKLPLYTTLPQNINAGGNDVFPPGWKIQVWLRIVKTPLEARLAVDRKLLARLFSPSYEEAAGIAIDQLIATADDLTYGLEAFRDWRIGNGTSKVIASLMSDATFRQHLRDYVAGYSFRAGMVLMSQRMRIGKDTSAVAGQAWQDTLNAATQMRMRQKDWQGRTCAALTLLTTTERQEWQDWWSSPGFSPHIP